LGRWFTFIQEVVLLTRRKKGAFRPFQKRFRGSDEAKNDFSRFFPDDRRIQRLSEKNRGIAQPDLPLYPDSHDDSNAVGQPDQQPHPNPYLHGFLHGHL